MNVYYFSSWPLMIASESINGDKRSKRGRPSKTQRCLSVREGLRARINSLIDDNIYVYEKTVDGELRVQSRRQGECLPEQFGAEFDEVTEQLRKLLAEYRQLQPKEEDRPLPESLHLCREVEEMLDDECESEKTDDGQCKILEPCKNSRTSYLRAKAPLEQFDDKDLAEFPEDKRALLIEHFPEIFSEEVTYQRQIEIVMELVYDTSPGSHSGPTYIGRLFGVTAGTISSHFKRMNHKRRELVGRPGSLADEELNILYLYVVECYQHTSSPNIPHLIDYCFNTFNVSLTTKTLKGILRRSSEFKEVPGIPLESSRADVPLSIVLDHYDRLDSLLSQEEIPPEFFYNVDESGFQEFADAKKEIVIIPGDCQEEEVYYSVNRASKRSTLIGCICADGTAMKPLVIIQNKTVQKELVKNGYGEENCLIVYQENGFVSSEIFAFWADHLFFPLVKEKRKRYNYLGPVILTMDGCSSHMSDYFLDEAFYHGVIPWFEPAGTSDQVQALDLGIFAIQKRQNTKTMKKKDLNEQSKAIIRIVDSWRKATTPLNVVSAFNQAGLYSVTDNNTTRMRASAEKARAVRGIEHTPCDNQIIGNKTQKILAF